MEETIANEELKKAIKSRKRMEILFIIQLLIFLGLFIFVVTNVANNRCTGGGAADIHAQEIYAFNSKFLSYEGSKVSGSNARTLYYRIEENNKKYTENPDYQVKLTIETENKDAIATDGVPATEPVIMPENTIRAGYTYKVTFGYDKQSGRIVNCTIAKQ